MPPCRACAVTPCEPPTDKGSSCVDPASVVYSLIASFTQSFLHSFLHSLTPALMYSFMHSFIVSLTHSANTFWSLPWAEHCNFTSEYDPTWSLPTWSSHPLCHLKEGCPSG